MEILTNSFILVLSVVLLSAILGSQAGSKFGIPSLLLFLMAGMAFGTDGVGIEFDSPMLTQFIGMIALSVILFSGGMGTNYDEIRPVAVRGVILATVGVVLMAFATGGFIYFASVQFNLGFSFLESLLMASIMSSTDSASVFSMLGSKKQGLKHNLKPLLELESGSNDPVAVIMTVVVLDLVMGGGSLVVGDLIVRLLKQLSIGFVAGWVFGKAITWTINKAKISNNSLSSIMLLALVFITFSITDLAGGNGYLAVYIAGMIVGNSKVIGQKSLYKSLDGYTWLVQIIMFITLGLLVTPHKLIEPETAFLGVAVGLFMILIARPLVVFVCMFPFRKMSFRDKLYTSWVGLRGAVPIILATYPLVAVNSGFNAEVADTIFNVVFFITILSLALQGSTLTTIAERLGLSEPIREDSFGIDLPDNIQAALTELDVTEPFLQGGSTIREVTLPSHTLVLFVKRGDRFIVPKGDTRLAVGDVLLLVWDDSDQVNEQLKELDITR
ncbi:MAG: potassium/proton antiporter [Rikenellaceae bacterium]|nr:potassium/proton antiporter [Rikenellaceae bacterium]